MKYKLKVFVPEMALRSCSWLKTRLRLRCCTKLLLLLKADEKTKDEELFSIQTRKLDNIFRLLYVFL